MDETFKNSLIKGAAGTGFGLVSSGANALFSHFAAERAYERQVDFWNMQNEYNSPHEQRKRLARAGLNPSAALGEVATSQRAGELSSVPQNEVMAQGAFDLSAIVDSLKSISEIENIAASTDKLTAEVATEMLEQVLKRLGIDEKSIEIGKKKIEYESWQDRVNAEIEKIRNEGYRAWAEGQSVEKKLPYEIGSLEAGIREKDSATEYNKALTETENQLREYKKRFMAAQTDAEKAAAAHDYAQASLVPSMIENIEADTSLKRSQKVKTDEEASKVREEVLQLMDSAEFNLIIKEATANEAQARALHESMKAEASKLTFENLRDAPDLLTYLANLADAMAFKIFGQ